MSGQAVAAAFHGVAQLKRADIFGSADARYVPVVAAGDAAIAAPGWVGANWRPGGPLLVGVNPGGGTDAYRATAEDQRLYDSLRQFRAASEQESAAALRELSDVWIRVERAHRLWKLIRGVLSALGATEAEAAFINFLPFRTRKNALPTQDIRRRAWQLATEPQITALQPGRIFALGQKAYRAMIEQRLEMDVVELQRTNGDYGLSRQASNALAKLAGSRRETLSRLQD